MRSASPARLTSLDGLRGLAALVVLAHHALLTMSGFSSVYWAEPFPSWVTPFAYTPLHALWAGQEAVLVFFVLSGAVLMVPGCPRSPTGVACVLPQPPRPALCPRLLRGRRRPCPRSRMAPRHHSGGQSMDADA